MGNLIRQYPGVIYPPVSCPDNEDMDKFELRRLRLRELIDAACSGKIALFAEKISRSDSYASRMLYPEDKKGRKRIGDDMMVVIEEAFNLPRAWLDLPLGMDLPGHAPEVVDAGNVVRYRTRWNWPFKRVTPNQYSLLSPVQQGHVEDTILMLLEVGQLAPSKSAGQGGRTAQG